MSKNLSYFDDLYKPSNDLLTKDYFKDPFEVKYKSKVPLLDIEGVELESMT